MKETKTLFKQITVGFAVALSLVAACLLAGCSASSNEKVELEIYAANSLTDAMTEAQEAYTAAHPEVTFADSQFEASGTLVQKMEAGGKPDIFISANKKNMDKVVEDGLVAEDAPFDMFANDLVIVAADSSDLNELTLQEAASGTYTIAVGDKNVPAGTYAKQALYTVGCYTNESGTDGEITGPIKGKVTEADKVGSVCSYAQAGEVDLGFVYSSDVMRYGGVKVVCIVPSTDHQPILYPAAVTKDSEHAEAAAAFLEWCTTDPEAQKIWQKWGFELEG
ncbi:molybdate ABC transporter substrate-binding protein [Anaerotardibacter muris]|uniref:molybdate ABC transporter substrate-binding protein n=1 Tax=Anaerotardibacter muris TaxID=2941505 RepID=UPI00203F5C51|nr:molybdate ABC transporter substrate-binding protein [Anaerotardibacter muris]